MSVNALWFERFVLLYEYIFVYVDSYIHNTQHLLRMFVGYILQDINLPGLGTLCIKNVRYVVNKTYFRFGSVA